MAEYADAYGGGWPDPAMPWTLFMALVRRAHRYDSRKRLRLTDSVASAIGAAFGGGSEVAEQRERLRRDAYGLTAATPWMMKNTAAKTAEDGDGAEE